MNRRGRIIAKSRPCSACAGLGWRVNRASDFPSVCPKCAGTGGKLGVTVADLARASGIHRKILDRALIPGKGMSPASALCTLRGLETLGIDFQTL